MQKMGCDFYWTGDLSDANMCCQEGSLLHKWTFHRGGFLFLFIRCCSELLRFELLVRILSISWCARNWFWLWTWEWALIILGPQSFQVPCHPPPPCLSCFSWSGRGVCALFPPCPVPWREENCSLELCVFLTLSPPAKSAWTSNWDVGSIVTFHLAHQKCAYQPLNFERLLVLLTTEQRKKYWEIQMQLILYYLLHNYCFMENENEHRWGF